MNDMVEVRVTDNGIGIPEEARGQVFESFFRAAPGEYAGTGLGLSICAMTVERHGGRIGATAGEHGVGTTMVFTLPAPDSGLPPESALSAVGVGAATGVARQRDGRTTKADPPPRRTGSETAVS